MLLELAQGIIERQDIPNETVYVLLQMLIRPFLYVLRGMAVLGIAYPALSMIGLSQRSPYIVPRFVFLLFWGVINIFVFTRDVDEYWKWLWIDMVGLILGQMCLFSWHDQLVRLYYLNLYKRKKRAQAQTGRERSTR